MRTHNAGGGADVTMDANEDLAEESAEEVTLWLPSRLVEWIDMVVAAGRAASRAAVVADAVERAHQQWRREERLAARRAALLETPTFTLTDLAARRGEDEDTTYAWLLSHRHDGRLVVIPIDNELVIPAFQFDQTGTPIAAVAEVNRIFATARVRTLWAMWSWWHARTSYLSGQSPIELIDSAPDRLLIAARREATTDMPG